MDMKKSLLAAAAVTLLTGNAYAGGPTVLDDGALDRTVAGRIINDTLGTLTLAGTASFHPLHGLTTAASHNSTLVIEVIEGPPFHQSSSEYAICIFSCQP